jgi:hypothetical protein
MKVISSENIFGVLAKSFLYKVFTLERKQQTMLRPVFFFFLGGSLGFGVGLSTSLYLYCDQTAKDIFNVLF